MNDLSVWTHSLLGNIVSITDIELLSFESTTSHLPDTSENSIALSEMGQEGKWGPSLETRGRDLDVL